MYELYIMMWPFVITRECAPILLPKIERKKKHRNENQFNNMFVNALTDCTYIYSVWYCTPNHMHCIRFDYICDYYGGKFQFSSTVI